MGVQLRGLNTYGKVLWGKHFGKRVI